MTASKRSAGQSGREAASPDGAELLGLELQQIQSAESQLSRLLPSLVEVVDSEQLKNLIQLREEQGKRILGELETAFDELAESPPEKENAAARGLIQAAEEHLQEIEQGPALDAALIAGIQKVEHYCIAAWGTARSLAKATGQKAAVQTMEHALKEGKSLDEKLTELAENEITPALLAEEADEEEGTGEARERTHRKSTGSGSSRNAPRH